MRHRIETLAFARTLTLALVAIIAAGLACAAPNEEVIDLKDGGRVVIHTDGSMTHYRANGAQVIMAEGEVMIAKDGTRLLMKGQALWQEIVEQAAAFYGLASRSPWTGNGTNGKSIELADGGRLTVLDDGTMVHTAADGTVIRMKDGDVMTAKDGTAILMNNGSLWNRTDSRRAPGSAP